MEINILSGSNAPQDTNVLMGLYNDTDQNIDVNTLSTLLKADYNTFFNFTGNYMSLTILNAPYSLEANRVTPLDVELDTMVIDYETLSLVDKKKIDDLVNVFNN
jgi:hypothetical protein